MNDQATAELEYLTDDELMKAMHGFGRSVGLPAKAGVKLMQAWDKPEGQASGDQLLKWLEASGQAAVALCMADYGRGIASSKGLEVEKAGILAFIRHPEATADDLRFALKKFREGRKEAIERLEELTPTRQTYGWLLQEFQYEEPQMVDRWARLLLERAESWQDCEQVFCAKVSTRLQLAAFTKMVDCEMPPEGYASVLRRTGSNNPDLFLRCLEQFRSHPEFSVEAKRGVWMEVAGVGAKADDRRVREALLELIFELGMTPLAFEIVCEFKSGLWQLWAKRHELPLTVQAQLLQVLFKDYSKWSY